MVEFQEGICIIILEQTTGKYPRVFIVLLLTHPSSRDDIQQVFKYLEAMF